MEDQLYTLKYKIENDNFATNSLSDNHLYLKICNASLSIGVFDPNNTEFIYYEKHQFALSESIIELIIYLQKIWNSHHFLNSNAWVKINVILTSANFSYVPSALFEPKVALGYLKLNCQIKESEYKILSFKDNHTKITCCFPVHKTLFNWLDGIYNGIDITYIHATNSFMNGITQDKDTQNKVCLNVEDELLSVTFNNTHNIQFINVYNFITDEDFVYYVLLVYKELNLDLLQTPLIIWGINEETYKLSKLRNYIADISIGHLPKKINYDPKFDRLLQQYDFDLFHAPLMLN